MRSASSSSTVAPEQPTAVRRSAMANSDHQTEEKSTDARKDAGTSGLASKMPPWLSSAIRKPRTWKTFFRCMIATLAAMVVMLAQSSLNVLGQAAFFGLIMSQMLPPSMALSIYIFAFLTLAIGMLTGWAWGVAAMAAALRARSQILLQSDVTRERATYTQDTNLDQQYQQSIFRGAFLDPRSSTVYGVFFFLGCYAFGFTRAKFPRLTLGAIFGTIILDLMCSYGPLFPITQYTLASNLLLPASVFLAIALLSTILIFPQSLHSILLTQVNELCLTPIKSLLDVQTQVLDASPSDHDAWGGIAAKASGLRKAHVMGATAVGGQAKLLSLEITHGRFGAYDLQRLVEKEKVLGQRAFGLASFVMTIDERNAAGRKMASGEGLTGSHPQPHRKRMLELQDQHRHPGTALDDLMPLLRDSTSNLRTSASEALSEAMKWLDEVNHSRWKSAKKASSIALREEALARLKSELEIYRSQGRHAMLEPVKSAFDSNGHLISSQIGHLRYSTRDLFSTFLLSTHLIYFCLELIEFLDLLLEIERASPKNKWNFPKKVVENAKGSASERNEGGNPLDLGRHDDQSEETLVEPKGGKEGKKARSPRHWQKDPDASDPRNGLQRFGRSIHVAWRALTGVNGIFALKYAIVSIALWIPQVIESSAFFVYTNRGLWALIMAQTGMGIFTGEQIASFVLRFAGTVIGLVLGMLAWYIGAQLGPGNPYGVAAATMVILAVPLFVRINAPMQSPPMIVALMTGVTTTFVVGYSWVDEHIYQTANQGSGAGLAGRRALLVLIGFTAAFIVMLFPKPTSARLIVRRSIARNIADISDLYASIIDSIESESELNEEGDRDGSKEKEGRVAQQTERFVKIMGRLSSLSSQMKFASIEPGLKGPWPKAAYEELHSLEVQLISSLAVLANSFNRLEHSWAKRIADRSDMLRPAFIADIMSLFALLHQSLHNGKPLPPMMPIFERLGYHSLSHSGSREGSWGKALRSAKSAEIDSSKTEKASMTVDGGEGQVDAEHSTVDHEEEKVLKALSSEMTIDMAKDEQFAIYSTANVALIHITSRLNELHGVIIGLVGERELEAFDRTQERWARRDMEQTSV